MSGPLGNDGVADTGGSGYSGTDDGQSQGFNPAWNNFLQDIPQELHPKVMPHLQEWDKGVNERFAKVHQIYEPWKPIVNSGVDPDTAQFALNVINALEEDPRKVYEAIGEFYKFNEQQAAEGSVGQGQGANNEPEDPYAARFAELEDQNRTMANILMAQRSEALEREAMAALDNELSALKKSKGDFDEGYVLMQLTANPAMKTEDAVDNYFSWRDRTLKQHSAPPLLMGAGGGIPGAGVDVSKLDASGTKQLIVDMLRANAAQNNQ